MHKIIHPPAATYRGDVTASVTPEKFREPSHDLSEQQDAMKLIVYVPGVAASGVEIEARGTDLTVTARKQNFVRVNWQALHLENVQRDYRLRLRLGHGFDYAAMEAEIREGVLTIYLPKRAAIMMPLQQVA